MPSVASGTTTGPADPSVVAQPRAARPYLSIDELAAVTPWSVDAIQKMVQRGLLKRGIHYFQPFGRRTQLIFKWDSIVALIEGSDTHARVVEMHPRAVIARRVTNVEKAETELQRLLS